jgi:hypothetical protein
MILKVYEKILNLIQICYPVYLIYIISLIRRKLILNYLILNNFKYNKIFDSIYKISYNCYGSKNIIIINGGGLIADDCADLVLSKLLLPNLNNYSIITIKYTLFNKFSKTVKEIIDSIKKIENLNISIDIFISDSIGSSLLLESLNYFGMKYKNTKLILISPCINFNLLENDNKNKDIINYDFCKYIFEKYIDKNFFVNKTILPKSLIITSSDELFYYDIIEFSKSLNNSELFVLYNCKHADIIHYGLINKKSVKETLKIILKFILP